MSVVVKHCLRARSYMNRKIFDVCIIEFKKRIHSIHTNICSSVSPFISKRESKFLSSVEVGRRNAFVLNECSN